MLILVKWLSMRIYFFSYRWVFGVVLSLLIVALGYRLTESTFRLQDKNHFSNIHPTPEVYWARIVDQPKEKKKTYNAVIEIIKVKSKSEVHFSIGKVMCYFSKIKSDYIPAYGDLIIFSKSPGLVEKPGNPGEFDYAGYLAHKRIYHDIFLGVNEFKLIEQNTGTFIKSLAYHLSEKTRIHLKKYIPNDPDTYTIAAAILTGHDELSDDQRRMFSDSGIIHILSVSGLHVGVVFLMAEFLLSFISVKKNRFNFKPFLILIIIWFYALYTGLSVPVVRASLMFSLILIGKLLRLQKNNYNILAASAFILLIIDPGSLFNVGFQLSFAAVAGIMIFKNPITDLWSPQNPILKNIWDLISISFAAQIFITPLIIYYFHRFPVCFALANLVAVPLSGIIIYTGVAFLILSMIPFIGSILSWLLIAEIRLLNDFIKLIDMLPGSVVTDIHMGMFSTFVLFALLTFLALFITTVQKRYIWPTLISALILSGGYANRKIEIHNQHFIVFHKVKNHTLISFIREDNQTILTDSELADNISAVSFYLDGLVADAGIKNRVIKEIKLPDENQSTTYQVPQFVVFNKKRIGLVQGACRLPDIGHALKVDYVLLCNNPSVSIDQINSHFPGAVIIIDNTCTFRRIEEYKTQSTSIGIKLYDLNHDGAFIVKDA